MIFEGTKKSIFFGLGLTRAGVASPIAGAIDHNPAEGVMLLDEKK